MSELPLRDRLLRTALIFGAVAAVAALAGFLTAPNWISIAAGLVAAAALVRSLMVLRTALRPEAVRADSPPEPPFDPR